MSPIAGPLVLAILDGFGCAPAGPGNAIELAKTPEWDAILAAGSHTTLLASGEAVGLPKGVMGNSEVGHINIGSGRVVPQGVVVINESITDGTFAKNAGLAETIEHVRKSRGRVHVMGLLSDGSVHSSITHLEAIVDVLASATVPFVIDVFADGRDVPPRSVTGFVDRMEAFCSARGVSDAIASITGRFYAMDRDKRWERTQAAYGMLIGRDVRCMAKDVQTAIATAYAGNVNDEFMVPTQIGEPRPVADGDAIIFFNFRPDRARQITLAFTRAGFSDFPVQTFENLRFVSMTRYDEDFKNPILFGPRPQNQTFGEIIAAAGMSQLRLAETEKYAHVTYFFNGGREDVFANEDRTLIPSDRTVETYDLAPDMRAKEITDIAVDDLANRRHDVIILNYANADMVGHTGVLGATVSSVETLDRELGRLRDAVLAADGVLAITADHGNAEEKLDKNGNALTAHTTNPVPFLLLANEKPQALQAGGKLGDIAPTLLPLLGLHASQEMTGTNLLTEAAMTMQAAVPSA